MKKKIGIIILVVVLLALIGGAAYFWRAKVNLTNVKYQAVFLTNGQVYFGKLSHRNGSYVQLTNIYYLQLRDPLQSQQNGDQAQPATTTQNKQSDLTLVKLGKELHGPADIMQINRDQILFIEELTNDSKVVAAIKDYQAKQ